MIPKSKKKLFKLIVFLTITLLIPIALSDDISDDKLQVSFSPASGGSFGISMPYWDENPLHLAPGENTTIKLFLQNNGDKDIILSASLSNDGEGIAILEDSNTQYSLLVGTSNLEVPIKIIIPRSLEIGSTKNIEVTFDQLENQKIIGSFIQNFPLEVVEESQSVLFENKPNPSSKRTYLLLAILAFIILIVALAILIWSILKERRSNSKQKKDSPKVIHQQDPIKRLPISPSSSTVQKSTSSGQRPQ